MLLLVLRLFFIVSLNGVVVGIAMILPFHRVRRIVIIVEAGWSVIIVQRLNVLWNGWHRFIRVDDFAARIEVDCVDDEMVLVLMVIVGHFQGIGSAFQLVERFVARQLRLIVGMTHV